MRFYSTILALLFTVNSHSQGLWPSSEWFGINIQSQTTAKGVVDALGIVNTPSSGSSSIPSSQFGVWISPDGPSLTTDNGSSALPFHCPNSLLLSNVFASLKTQTNIAVHLTEGKFIVAPASLFVNSGWTLSGAGKYNTILRFQTNSPFSAPAIMVDAVASRLDCVTISDMTIDCNFYDQTNVSEVGACRMNGSNLRFSRLRAINWGTHNPEMFILYMGADPVFQNTNNIIEDCEITQPAMITGGGGIGGIVCSPDQSAIFGKSRGCICRNNYIYSIVAGTGGAGSPSYFHAIDWSSGLVERNYLHDLTGTCAGYYHDTYSSEDIIIQDNVMDNVKFPIDENLSMYHRERETITGNKIRVAEGGIGINYDVSPGTNANAYCKHLIIMNNVITPSASAVNVYALHVFTRYPSIIFNNVFQGAGGGYDVSVTAADLGGGTNVFNGNYNFTGYIPAP